MLNIKPYQKRQEEKPAQRRLDLEELGMCAVSAFFAGVILTAMTERMGFAGAAAGIMLVLVAMDLALTIFKR